MNTEREVLKLNQYGCKWHHMEGKKGNLILPTLFPTPYVLTSNFVVSYGGGIPKSETFWTMMYSTPVLLFMIDEEEWGYLNDWEPDQLIKKRTKICMCCDHFRYACTVQCVTLLTCPVHQKLIPQGDHLIKGCKYWVKRRELREGWCPEVA